MSERKQIQIRPLRESDLDAVMQLHRELGWNPAFQADGSTLRQRLAALIGEENSLLLGRRRCRIYPWRDRHLPPFRRT